MGPKSHRLEKHEPVRNLLVCLSRAFVFPTWQRTSVREWSRILSIRCALGKLLRGCCLNETVSTLLALSLSKELLNEGLLVTVRRGSCRLHKVDFSMSCIPSCILSARLGDLRAGSVDRGIVSLGIGAGTGSGCLSLLATTHLSSGDSTVSAQNGESNVLVKDLAACNTITITSTMSRSLSDTVCECARVDVLCTYQQLCRT